MLGARPPKLDDRTLPAGDYLAPDLPVPATVDWHTRVPSWPMYLNNRIGCCTCTAAADLILGWTTNAGTPRPVGDPDVLAAYEAVSGYTPDDPASDRGAYELDVLNHWRHVGVGGHQITAYVKVDHTDHRQVRQAVNVFGGVYIALALPQSARAQARARQVWRPAIGVEGRKGSWGGHAVAVFGYTPQTLTCVTWGGLQRMSWGFWSRYTVEAYAVVSADFLNAAGRDPQGLDLPALLADLTAIHAQ